jgi:arabinose-5-phosphate isomerase
MNYTDLARRVFDKEIDVLKTIRDCIGDDFERILLEIIRCKGKTIVTGMGKSGHIARKIAASLASLGTPSIFIHPGEAMHGDLGSIQKQDLVIAISYSGESDEIIRIIPGINAIGAHLIGITGNPDSMLAKNSNIVQVFPPMQEACHMGVAPTSSTTAALVYGDALAVVASQIRAFGRNDFKVYHPAGALGKNLTLRVADCMRRAFIKTHLTETSTVREAVALICGTRWEIFPVCQPDNETVLGIISSDKVSAFLDSGGGVLDPIQAFIDYEPRFTGADTLAAEALKSMTEAQVDILLVMNDHTAAGVVSRHDIMIHGVIL